MYFQRAGHEWAETGGYLPSFHRSRRGAGRCGRSHDPYWLEAAGRPVFSGEMQAIIDKWRPVPVVFLAEREEWAQVVRAMEIGARGYIPTSVDTRVCVEAIHLATAGGMYVPASMVTKPAAVDIDEDVLGELLTAREVEVVHAIRLGRSNKVIAYELGMSEGTVKAHVHNIMKKIGAANRTEVACMLHKMYGNMQNEN